MKKMGLILLSLVMFITLFLVTPVFAYNGEAAKNYADTYALNPNYGSYAYWTEDCTNFVSQALYAGGYSMVGYWPVYSTTDDHNWYWSQGWYQWTHSWSVANDQVNFQILHQPGGYYGNSYNGDIGNSEYNDAYIGDILAYNWYGGSGGWDHLALEVGPGTDPSSGWVGDLVDEHTTNRYHAYWTLQPYNAYYYQTVVQTVHISSSN